MTTRRKLRAELETAHKLRARAEDDAARLSARIAEQDAALADLKARHEQALAAQREEHAAVQRGHLTDLAQAREESLRAIHRDLLAELEEARAERAVANQLADERQRKIVEVGEQLIEVRQQRDLAEAYRDHASRELDAAVRLARNAITNRDPAPSTVRRWRRQLDELTGTES